MIFVTEILFDNEIRKNNMVVTETIVIILINPKISLWSWCCLHSESKVSLFLSLVEILVKSERIKVSSLRKVILCDTKKCTFEAKFYWYSNFPLKYGTFLQNFNAEVRNISVSQKCPHFAKKNEGKPCLQVLSCLMATW